MQSGFPYVKLAPKLAGALKDFFLRSVGKIYLFGVEIEDIEELRAKPETSGRDLAVGMDEAWY